MIITEVHGQRKCPCCGLHKSANAFVGVFCKQCDKDSKEEFDPSIEPKPVDREGFDTLGPRGSIFDEPEAVAVRRKLSGAELVAEAQRVLARRQLGRKYLLPFVEEFRAGYKAGWVHRDVCARLEKFLDDVVHGRSPRLMLFMPPRSGKSELGTRSFPAWGLGKYPWLEFICTSYAASLANTFSRKAREIMRDPAFGFMFPESTLDKNNQAVEQWMTTDGGGYVSAGVGGSIVGKGANVLIIDDPTKGREEAKSETIQEQIRDWYTGSAYTRLAPGGGVLIIMQRWSEDDLAGWLLSEDESKDEELRENWEVVRYPAIAVEDEEFRKTGEALHPERYPLQALKRIRSTLGERDWHALYQQDPLPATGDYFTEDMFKYAPRSERPPLEEMNVYAAWDLAITESERNDMSVGFYVGVCPANLIWVLHVERLRVKSLPLAERIFELDRIWKPHMTGFEKGHIEGTMGPFLDRMMIEKRQFFAYEPLPVGRSDKEARATTIRAMMQAGIVIWDRNDAAQNEAKAVMLKFPNGKHDDDVDSIAHIGRMVERLAAGRKKQEQKKKDGWRERLMKNMGKSAGHNSYKAL